MATTVQEIQTTLSLCLPNNNLRLQVNQTGNQLSVVINRPSDQEAVNYDDVADVLLTKLRSCSLPNITAVKFYGRPANTKQIEWQATHPLATQVDQAVVNSHTTLNGASTANGASLQKPKSKFQNYLEQFSHYSNVISAASLLGLLLLLGFNTLAGQKTQAVVWEYKIESVPDLAFTETMDQLGTNGWELTAARRAKDSTTDDFSYECIFKRIKK
jgi:hypothetical protein